jgi:hypothetical protein
MLSSFGHLQPHCGQRYSPWSFFLGIKHGWSLKEHLRGAFVGFPWPKHRHDNFFGLAYIIGWQRKVMTFDHPKTNSKVGEGPSCHALVRPLFGPKKKREPLCLCK